LPSLVSVTLRGRCSIAKIQWLKFRLMTNGNA